MTIRNIAKILCSAMLAGVVFFAACDDSATAPRSTGSIIGDVTMEGRGLDGVTASLSNGTTATTATDGSFRFDGIAPGTYDVSISGYPAHAAFGSESTSVTVGAEGGSATVAFGATNSDRDALVALYDSTGGGNWIRNDNWLTSAPLADWYGVTTDANGRVTALWLYENNLRGTIPAAVGGLTQLDVLALFREPGLTGAIPSELGDLANLRLLALGGNNLAGPIPTELGDLTNLTGLYLWGNRLTGTIPSELGRLSKLQALQLDGPFLSAAAHADGLPGDSRADVAQSPELPGPYRTQTPEFSDRDPVSADIAASRHNVGLTGPIPSVIWNLRDLTLLTLARNRLTGGIPPEIANLTNLEEFSVQDNELTGAVPSALWGLTDLTLLAIAGNRLTGSIPPEIGDLSDLKIFWAANNNLSGSIPPEIENLDSLTHLGLHDNSLTGTVPASLGNLSSLIQLTLSRNDLQGTIPPELGNLRNLEVLYLNQNRLDGSIPPELGALDSLTSLSLRGNELTGGIPQEIGNLSKLMQLWVHSNPLSGPLPLDMTRLANLSVFNFSDTRLCVPDDQSFVSWLQSVGDVIGSGLDCGTVSNDRDVLVELYNATDGPNWTHSTNWVTNASLGQWYGVTTDANERVIGLDLEENNLSGPLPAELSQLGSLEELILADAGISGTIPPELGKLGSLTVLNLVSDSLTGPIPRELGDLTSLQALGLGGSPLTGSIPPELGNLANLETLVLLGTEISDSIPPELGNLGNLTELILAENNLSGTIPEELGNLTQLEVVSLQGNDLSGPVPSELGNLSQLEGMLLDDNLLTGQVPESFLGLDQLQALSIERNNGLCFPDTDAFTAWLGGLEFAGPFCQSSDRAALASLYEATDGPNWTNQRNWLTDAPLDDWYGVDVDSAGRVDWLSLGRNNLSGEIPAELGRLNALRSLILRKNNLTGPIPPELGTIARLSSLDLGENDLRGPIPPILGQLASLGHLNLGDNDLSGTIPVELGNLARLTDLSVEGNRLTGWIPSELGNLGFLSSLSLSNNDLDGPIPDSFVQLQRLSFLSLDPANCVPATDAFSDWLRRIGLGFAYTRGTIRCHPDAGALVSLFEATDGPNWTNRDKWLTLAPLAQWYGVTTDASGRVVSLGLGENNLTGAIPPQLGDLANLEELSLRSNNLWDPIPSALGNLPLLSSLSLSNNYLDGPVPESFVQLQRLRVLDLDPSNCVPATDAFTAWLRRIDSGVSGTIRCHPDAAALVALYEATDGPNWTDRDKWLTLDPLGDWSGVTTDASGRVVVVELAENNLTGAIPPQLGNLANLEVLALQSNSLSDPVPSELGKLANLRTLYLNNNNLTGEIPPELSNLADLQYLVLGDNRLSGSIPPELAKLANLIDVNLNNNRLSGSIPPGLGKLANLRLLRLGGNRLADSIPAELGNLESLELLYLYSNRLTGRIPPELGNLANLRELWLQWNDLVGPLPAELAAPRRLRSVLLEENNLNGPIPDDFLGQNGLRTFRYHENAGLCAPGTADFVTWLSGIQNTLGSKSYCNEADVKVLERLYETSGGPNWTNSSGWLQTPVLGEWDGVTADALGRVLTLDLTRNGLAGELRANLGSLAKMTTLRLGGNALSGRLPLSLHRLALVELRYAGTSLCAPTDAAFQSWLNGIASLEGTGTVCGTLSDRDILEVLYETTGGPGWTNSSNWLTGATLADWHGVHTDASGRVTDLLLARNGLSGSIPLELGSLDRLRRFDALGNGLTGPIPPELGNLGSLQQLYLSDNDLTGPIPAELGSLDSLVILSLSGNDLTGPIPAGFGNLARLQYMWLSDGNLTGPVPPELGKLSFLQQLYLSGNDLSGPIPVELGRLDSLVVLQISDNHLTGPIPAELGSLDSLLHFHANHNELEGPIPPQLGGLGRLRELGLSANPGLSGALPLGLTRLGDLEALVASGTSLCAPSDPAFRRWLAGVENRHVELCDEPPPAAYLVQAVQSPEFPVPLVAGREALLRVFVTAARDNNEPLPPVRASFYDDGSLAHVTDIFGGTRRIPTEVEEGSLATSVNALVPGAVVRPGLEMTIEIDPYRTLDSSLGVAKRIPETGRLPVDVREMPLFDLTLIPFILSENPDSTILDAVASTVADPEQELWQRRPYLPVGDLVVRDHEPVMTSSNNAYDLLRQTRAIRAMEGGDGYYMGTMSRPVTGASGVAYRGGWSLFSLLPGPTAHELGHSFNLAHAPCGGAGGPDPAYPYPGAQIGAWGYNPLEGALVPPTETDIMSYCGGWISDYHYAKALRHRLGKEGARGAAAPTAALLLWGGIDADGVPFLDPVFLIDAPPLLPDSAGEYRLTGRSEDRDLFTLDFTMPEVPHGDGRSSFVFALPAPPGWAGDLANITLSGPGGSFTLDSNSDVPMTILRDPRTRRIRGFLREEPLVAQVAAEAAWRTAGSDLQTLFSRGIPDAEAWRR